MSEEVPQSRGSHHSSQSNNPAGSLQQEHLLCPVTAVAFCRILNGQLLVLVGEDGWLKVFDAHSLTLCGQLKVFASQPIHGIYVSHSPAGSPPLRLLIWGGQAVAILPLESASCLLQLDRAATPETFTAPDWIYDGLLSPYDAGRGVLLTAHNDIVHFDVGDDGSSVRMGQVVSPSRPILYSGCLRWIAPDCVLVAGGTVFGEIIVWKCYPQDRSEREALCEVLFVLAGHDGSILGVDISAEMELAPDVKVRFLASCSDDRTIRVWDITERAVNGTHKGNCFSDGLREARETGFGRDAEADVESKSAASTRHIATAMGHLSRIWHVKFSSCRNDGALHSGPLVLYSFGEDATRQRWELSVALAPLRRKVAPWTDDSAKPESPEMGPGLSGVLENTETLSCHTGKNIWSAACFGDDDDESLVATGGADGKVTLIGYTSPMGSSQRELLGARAEHKDAEHKDLHIAVAFDDVLQSIRDVCGEQESANAGSHQDAFLCYAFVSEHTLLVHAWSGRMFHFSVDRDLLWEEVALSDDVRVELKSYAVSRSPEHGVAIIGAASGRLYLFEEKRRGLYPLTKFASKVSNILCLPRPAPGQDGQTTSHAVAALVTAVSERHATLLTIDSVGNKPAVVDAKRVELYKGFIVTGLGTCGNYLILGSRIGWIAVYSPSSREYVETASRRDYQTKDAVTSIVSLPGSTTSFVAGSRDGKYRVYNIRETAGEVTLSLQHEIASPLAFIEGIWFTKNQDGGGRRQGDGAVEMIMYGFRSKHFVVWNETTQQELARVECGGHHRSFDMVSNPGNPGCLSIVFSDVSKMRFYSQRQLPLRTVKAGGHGREIKAVASCGTYMATAAEDTAIRIWEYRDGGGGGSPLSRAFRCLAVLEKHTTGIQCLKWLGKDYLLSSAGNEEFYIWRISHLDSDYDALAVMCEAVCPDITTEGDLRVMGFDAERLDGDDIGGILVSLALSNSTLISYRYTKKLGFVLVAQAQYTGACLTQIRHLEMAPCRWCVLTASTDGHVALWQYNMADALDASGQGVGEYSLQVTTKLHQSAIKSLGMVQEGLCWHIITGGDDNALGVLNVQWCEDSGTFTTGDKHRIASAHAAAVTGLCVVGHESDAVRVATVSNDQRVRLWRVSSGPGSSGVRVALLDSKYSAVADPGDVELIRPGKLMVGGVGMEVWDMPW